MNSVIRLGHSNETHLWNQLRNLSLIVRNLGLAEPIFKIDSLDLLSAAPVEKIIVTQYC